MVKQIWKERISSIEDVEVVGSTWRAVAVSFPFLVTGVQYKRLEEGGDATRNRVIQQRADRIGT